MRPYPSYKDSGVPARAEQREAGGEWFDKIPSHWKTTKNKHYLIEKKSEVGEKWKDYPLLSLTKKGIIFRDVESGKGKYPGSFENYKVVEVGDLVFCLYDIEETPRTVGLSKHNGMITGSYKIFECDNVNPKFIYYYYLTVDDFKGLRPFYTGLRNVVRPETFKGLEINLPPLPEQKQIVSFLDHKTQKIDELIDKTEQKIELLKEKRTFLINHCVTKGLPAACLPSHQHRQEERAQAGFNPDVEMKDSGVPACAEQREAGGEWIGEIPSHWIKIKLFYITELITDGEHISPNFTNGGVPFLSSKDVYDRGVNINVDKFVSIEESIILRKRCNPEHQDILIVSRGAKIGRVSIVNTKKVFCLLGSVILLKLVEKVNNRFVFFLLSSNKILEELILLSGSSAQPAIYLDDLRHLQIPLPPLSEQQQIVEYLDEQTQLIDTTVEKETQRIELLKEYRQSLISEVVTGKIDVRGYNSTVLVEGETQSR